MIWKDIGYLLKINNFSENSSVATFLTSHHGLHNGIIYGATSKSKKKYLQIGNKFILNWKSKSEDSLGYYNLELSDAIAAKFFDQPKRLNLILSLSEICCKVLAERHDYSDLYEYTDIFLKNILEYIAYSNKKFVIAFNRLIIKVVMGNLKLYSYSFNRKITQCYCRNFMLPIICSF